LRDQRLSDAPAAIVSANAFDKGLDNDLGIGASDFLVKPVRMAELLGWLERRLAITWLDEAAEAVPDSTATASPLVPPPPDALRALDELVRLGYLRGIQKKLDALAAAHPASGAWLDRQRALARGFQLDTMAQLIQAALAEVASPPTPSPDTAADVA
jgi:CheY-like chemotaxis protein